MIIFCWQNFLLYGPGPLHVYSVAIEKGSLSIITAFKRGTPGFLNQLCKYTVEYMKPQLGKAWEHSLRNKGKTSFRLHGLNAEKVGDRNI